jgi:MFS family permease
VGEEEILDEVVKDKWKPLPLRSLIKRPAVLVSVANYGMIGLLDVIAFALIPLVWSTSVEYGGLGMSPASIGLWMAGYGLMNGIFQFVAFPPLVRHFGPRRVFITSILCFFPVYILFPFQNSALRHSSGSMNPTAALLVILQLTITAFSTMGFGEFSRT